MDELRESSLLFSLEGLLETERERVQREAREAERRREDELLRVATLAERRRVADQQQREARERRQVLEQERERLEQQRIDAMKQATVERARIEAEAELRLVEVEQARRHELSLLKIREQERASRFRALSWLGGGAFGLSVAVSVIAYFGFIAPAHAQTESQLRTLVESMEGRASAAERALDAERKKNRELQEAARLSPPSVAPVSSPPTTKTPTTPARPHTGQGGTSSTTARSVCEDNGDPLNSCLSGRKRAR